MKCARPYREQVVRGVERCIALCNSDAPRCTGADLINKGYQPVGFRLLITLRMECSCRSASCTVSQFKGQTPPDDHHAGMAAAMCKPSSCHENFTDLHRFGRRPPFNAGRPRPRPRPWRPRQARHWNGGRGGRSGRSSHSHERCVVKGCSFSKRSLVATSVRTLSAAVQAGRTTVPTATAAQ